MSPKTTKLIAKIIAIVLAIALVIGTFAVMPVFGASMAYGATSAEYLDRQLTSLRHAISDIQMNYKDEVMLESLVEGAFSGVVEALNDPHSKYYTTEEATTFLQNVNGQFSGIGVNLENFVGGCRIVAPLPGSPAEKAGILSGDQIIEVDGKDVTQLKVDRLVKLLKGDPGVSVRLKILRRGTALTFNITRAVIKSISVDFEKINDTIGYIRIHQFDNDTQNEFKAARQQLLNQGANRFIVDVRNNPGGYISSAAGVAGQLMPAGPISHLVKRGEIIETISASGEASTRYPVVLLINHGSASAAEILGGAWQDSRTARLVGTPSYGKGVAQQVFSLKNGGFIKLSECYFLTPDRHPINETGLTPDVLVINPAENEIAQIIKEYNAFAPMKEQRKPRAGDVGLNVYGAQQRLQLLGYNLKVTGAMDSATVSAIKAFQKSAGLFAYGVLDYSTMAAIDKTIAGQLLTLKPDDDMQLKKAIELLTVN
ncbi:MAG TPA: S41 family peptidase [Clostridiales bacterium]|jgi:carboxyl-terminal processing protease|nr:S41 family peptidase [Clostridiales bacterium]